MAENNENANMPSSSKRLASPSPKGGSAKPPKKKQNLQGIMAIMQGGSSAAATGHIAAATVKEEEEQMENETRNQMCFDKFIRDGAGVEHVIYQSKFSVFF